MPAVAAVYQTSHLPLLNHAPVADAKEDTTWLNLPVGQGSDKVMYVYTLK